MKSIESQMEDRGYRKQGGAAVIDDVVVTFFKLPHEHTRCMTLKKQEAVDFFNSEYSNGVDCELYRKV